MAVNSFNQLTWFYQESIDTSATGDKAVFNIPFKARLYRVEAMPNTNEATACTVKFDYRPTPGSDTGRGDGDAGVINFPAENKQYTWLYDKAERGLELDAGSQVVVEVTSASTASKSLAVRVLVDYLPETEENFPSYWEETT